MCKQVCYVNILAGGCKGSEIITTPVEHVDRAVMVPTLYVIERDPDLKDALIESTNRPGLFSPEVFKRFVLLEELATVELFNGNLQKNGRGVLTWIHHERNSSS